MFGKCRFSVRNCYSKENLSKQKGRKLSPAGFRQRPFPQLPGYWSLSDVRGMLRRFLRPTSTKLQLGMCFYSLIFFLPSVVPVSRRYLCFTGQNNVWNLSECNVVAGDDGTSGKLRTPFGHFLFPDRKPSMSSGRLLYFYSYEFVDSCLNVAPRRGLMSPCFRAPIDNVCRIDEQLYYEDGERNKKKRKKELQKSNDFR